jgi:hypothetical protein
LNNIYKKIIILVFGMLLSTACFSKTSWSTTVRLYYKLVEQNYLKPAKFLILVEDGDINAWVTEEDKLYVTTGLLKAGSVPEIALVLGHELAHIQFRDAHSTYKGGRKKPKPGVSKLQEDRADYYGRIYAENLGYSRCKMAHFFIVLYKHYGNQGGLMDPHSSNTLRFWRIYQGCNKIT